MALLLWLVDGCLVVTEADLVAEYGEVHRMLHLLYVLEVEDIGLGVDAWGDDVAYGRVCVFIHYLN